MAKRKREEIEGEEAGAARNDGISRIEKKRREVEENIAQGRKLLRRALVTAKAFEYKKMTKRVKAAEQRQKKKTNNGAGAAELGRLTRESEVLKTLDMGEVAATHLHKTLLKSKRIVESKMLPDYVATANKELSGDEETKRAIGNVTARLYNFKPVKENMANVMAGMYSILGISMAAQGSAERKPVVSKAVHETEEIDEIPDADDVASRHAKSGFDPDDIDEEDQSDDSEDFSRYDGLLGSSSDEECEDDMDSGDEIRKPSDKPTRTIKSRGISVSISGSSRSPSPSPSLSPSPEPDTKKTSKVVPAKSSSAFLPSLMGGYWSGSEEAASDPEDNQPATRKNRMGQRARQAIWEKKFGAGAKHVQRELAKSRASKKRAVGPDGEKVKAKGGRQPFKRTTAKMTGENAVPVIPRGQKPSQKQAEGPLHPSWEAKKRAKEMQKTAAFQGSKVVFD